MNRRAKRILCILGVILLTMLPVSLKAERNTVFSASQSESGGEEETEERRSFLFGAALVAGVTYLVYGLFSKEDRRS